MLPHWIVGNVCRFQFFLEIVSCEFNHLPQIGSFPLKLLSQQFGVIASSYLSIQVVDSLIFDFLEPIMLFAQEKNEILVEGKNFVDYNLTCSFNDQLILGIWIYSTQILCRLPASTTAQACKVRVSNDGFVLT